VVLDRIRTIAFALLTPFFFLRRNAHHRFDSRGGCGRNCNTLLRENGDQVHGVWPVRRRFDSPRTNVLTRPIDGDGLTFGSISALYGLTHHLINEAQYTELVTVVILSAFVPTLIAQQFFRPSIDITVEEQEALGEEDISLLHRRAIPPADENK